MIGEYDFCNLVFRLKMTKFSLIIDETTDINIKQLVLVGTHYNTDVQKTVDKFLIHLELKDATTLGIQFPRSRAPQQLQGTSFEGNEIAFENPIVFASDNASVVMGSRGA
ncbi:uncharacterized protein [Cherax quadricarinatus]|uniref:uncharacterized protein n=1 Tax=Cherax quadricarinatus TaxID=27406 RepID=UPI00387EB56B